MMSNFCLKQIANTINGIGIWIDLKTIEIKDFNDIMGINFLEITMQLSIVADEESLSSLVLEKSSCLKGDHWSQQGKHENAH